MFTNLQEKVSKEPLTKNVHVTMMSTHRDTWRVSINSVYSDKSRKGKRDLKWTMKQNAAAS